MQANLLRAGIVVVSLIAAVQIRLYAVKNYGRVIHEFDPWFNFRATEYMVSHGWRAFQAWFDEGVWYPLGRHVGSTTYPGLQLTAWGIHSALHAAGYPVSLNDVCVFIPAGFGALAAGMTGLLAWEVTRKPNAAVAATAIMAILPAHLMRSIAGGYDNESIAISAMVTTFYLWVRALRDDGAWPAAVLCGLSYIYMVAAWGGYVFVLNMIGLHATALVLVGWFSPRLWRAYTLWFLIGTAGAIFGPARYLVGWQPFQSLEQLGPTAVFFGLQLWQLTELMARRRRLDATGKLLLRLKVFGYAGVAVAAAGALLLPEGFIGPLSARVRGLFIKHTKTGNPLVDSVAEHQATPAAVYWHYFHFTIVATPLGLITTVFKDKSDAKLFLVVYTMVGGYFSGKMIRLVLLISPAATVCAGAFIDFCIAFLLDALSATEADAEPKDKKEPPPRGTKPGKPGKGVKKPPAARTDKQPTADGGSLFWQELEEVYHENVVLRRSLGLLMATVLGLALFRFVPHSFALAQSLSEPQIMVRGRNRDGSFVVIDDFREAYWWLKNSTPQDARIMAWWDYGYQINGVANRTTIADGNTWNHEHIALLGKCLVSPEDQSHAITRHLADYVLIWTTRHAGMYSDDLAKSPHMARIAGSVYPDISPQNFFMDRQGTPSKMMEASLLYNLHGWRLDPKIKPLTHFEEAYTTTNKMVRIYKVLDVSEESKAWRKEHGPGYPPQLDAVLKTSKAFKQIHGF